VLSAALLTLLCLPCAVAALVCADEMVVRRLWTRRGRREMRALRRLDRVLGSDDPIPALAEPGAPCIEQIAHDLRRLSHQRRHGPTQHSEQWLAAVMQAYDQRLSLACHCLGLAEHLEPLEGMDRDLERLRVESALQAAGLALR
jgi:hypothetical protein